MGYCLLYEAMLDSVIWARDQYLTADGLMVPSNASLRIAPLADPDLVASHADFWKDVYGFTMTSMLDNVYDEALIRSMDPSTIAGDSASFLELDLHTIQQTDLTFVRPFSLAIKDDQDMLDGWVVWFDIFFMPGRDLPLPADSKASDNIKQGLVAFTTGPDAKQTHWQQGVMMIDRRRMDTLALVKGQIITGHVGFQKKTSTSRSLDVEVLWNFQQAEDGVGKEERGRQLWSLG